MTHSITIETQNKNDIVLLKGLAKRLGLHIREADTTGFSEKPADQKELFRKMEKLRKKLSGLKVNPNIDLSELANEVNDTRL